MGENEDINQAIIRAAAEYAEIVEEIADRRRYR